MQTRIKLGQDLPRLLQGQLLAHRRIRGLPQLTQRSKVPRRRQHALTAQTAHLHQHPTLARGQLLRRKQRRLTHKRRAPTAAQLILPHQKTHRRKQLVVLHARQRARPQLLIEQHIRARALDDQHLRALIGVHPPHLRVERIAAQNQPNPPHLGGNYIPRRPRLRQVHIRRMQHHLGLPPRQRAPGIKNPRQIADHAIHRIGQIRAGRNHRQPILARQPAEHIRIGLPDSPSVHLQQRSQSPAEIRAQRLRQQPCHPAGQPRPQPRAFARAPILPFKQLRAQVAQNRRRHHDATQFGKDHQPRLLGRGHAHKTARILTILVQRLRQVHALLHTRHHHPFRHACLLTL